MSKKTETETPPPEPAQEGLQALPEVTWNPDMSNVLKNAEAEHVTLAQTANSVLNNSMVELHAVCTNAVEISIAILAESAKLSADAVKIVEPSQAES